MPEPRRIPLPRNDAGLLACDTRLAALTGNGGVETSHAATSRRRLEIARLETDA